MRAYHLTTEHWALESMKLRRLKLAMLEDMNDPFELLGIELKRPEDRAFFQKQLKPEMNRTIGLLCFSRKWSNPVLWSHYADKHHRLCLGFDIPDQHAKEVTYVGRRLKAEIENTNFSDDNNSPGYKLITTKYKHWQYEIEVRLIFQLEHAHREDSHYFIPYCDALALREIVVGLRSKLTDQHLLATLSPEDADVSIIRSRLAPHSYEVLPHQAAR
jgi:Protein of unknown function (DUF2971)